MNGSLVKRVRRLAASLLLVVCGALLPGCETQPVPSTVLEAPPAAGTPVYEPREAPLPPPPPVPLVWDYYLAPFGGEPWHMGWSRLEGDGPSWTSSYELFTVAGSLRGLDLAGGTACLLEDHGRPLSTAYTSRAPTNGFDIGALARYVAAADLLPGLTLRLPAYDLRQGLYYELSLEAGDHEDYATAWREGTGLRVDISPFGYTFWLAEDGWPELVRCAEGFAERRRPPR